ncbi:MAG: TIR domain-containing protein [Planctomycetaceae bacterium]|nr:TIR domain-containing protein [Planctomycetaceae bacterium]
MFISYGRKDASDLASRLSIDLAARGFEVWLDTHEIISGHDWQQQIVAALRASDVVVAILSPHAVRVSAGQVGADSIDSVCLDELSFARFAKPPKPIVPVMAIRCEPPFCIFRLDYVDMESWREPEGDRRYHVSFTRLVEAIQTAAGNGQSRHRDWAQFLDPWDFSAFVAEKRESFAGREWLFQRLAHWQSVSRNERALLITGDPGAGKSAIVAQLVHTNPRGQVLAYHCCQSNFEETLESWRFVRSVAAMIASQLPEYALRLKEPRLQDVLSEARCKIDPEVALELGVIAPLHAIAPPDRVRCVLVDALDEALLCKSKPSIVALLAGRLDRFPPWLRVIATTRKDPNVLSALRELRAETLDAHDPRNVGDVEAYLAERMKSPLLAERLEEQSLSAAVAVQRLSARSQGNFLYARQVLDAIERGICRLDELDAFVPGLEGLYEHFFTRAFPSEAAFSGVRTLLAVVVAAQEPLTLDQLLEVLKTNAAEETQERLEQLAVYLRRQEAADGVVNYGIFHKSLADWLCRPERTGQVYSVDMGEGHMLLAERGWAEYQASPDAMSAYSLAHLPVHLTTCERIGDLESLLTDLAYIRCKALANRVFELQREYDLLLSARGKADAERGLRPLRERTLLTYADNLSEYARKCVSASPVRPIESTTWWQRLGRKWKNSRHAVPAAMGEVLLPPPTPPETSHVLQAAMENHRNCNQAHEALRPTVETFAAFIAQHGRMLAMLPRECITLARNYAADGPVTEQAAAMAESSSRPWIARDPRPALQADRPLVLRKLLGHEGFVHDVDVTPDGSCVVSAGADGTVRVWYLRTGEEQTSLSGHKGAVLAVAVTADGRKAISLGRDQNLRWWDLYSKQCTREVSLQDDWDDLAATPDCSRVVLAGALGLKVIDSISGNERAIMDDSATGARAVAISQDGRVAVSAHHDGSVCLWDIPSCTEIRTLDAHKYACNDVEVSFDGRLIFSAGEDGRLRLWNANTGSLIREIGGHLAPVTATAMTPDGRLAISASRDDSLRLWDLDTGDELRVLTGHRLGINAVAISADGRISVSASNDRTLQCVDLTSLEAPAPPGDHVSGAAVVARMADGRMAVSAGLDGSVCCWDGQSGQLRHRVSAHSQAVHALAIVPGRAAVISASRDRTLQLINLQTGQVLRAFVGHSGEVYAVAVSSDGTLAASGGEDMAVRVWEVETGQMMHCLKGHRERVRSVAISHDGRRVVSAGWDRLLYVWDLRSGNLLHTLCGHTQRLNAVAISPDDAWAVSACDDQTLRIWDLSSGAERRVLHGHSDAIRSVTISPDSQMAVSASRDRTLRLWELPSGTSLGTLAGHVGPVRDAVFAPGGRRIVSAGGDHTVRLWDVNLLEQVAAFDAGGPVLCMSAIDDQSRLSCGTWDGNVHHLQLRNLHASIEKE